MTDLEREIDNLIEDSKEWGDNGGRYIDSYNLRLLIYKAIRKAERRGRTEEWAKGICNDVEHHDKIQKLAYEKGTRVGREQMNLEIELKEGQPCAYTLGHKDGITDAIEIINSCPLLKEIDDMYRRMYTGFRDWIVKELNKEADNGLDN